MWAGIDLFGSLFTTVLLLVVNGNRKNKIVFKEKVEALLFKERLDLGKICWQSFWFTEFSFSIFLSRIIDIPESFLIAIILPLLKIACRHVQYSYDIWADL